MALPYSDGTFTTWAAHGPPELEYPFEGDTSHYIVRQRFRGLIANYAAPNISGAAHSTYTSAYCVGDGPIVSLAGGPLGEVVREYATIPGTRSEAEFYPYAFPAITNGAVGGSASPSSASFESNHQNINVSATSHGFTTSNVLTGRYQAVGFGSTGAYIRANGVFTAAPLATGANHLIFRNPTPIVFGATGTLTVSNVTELRPGRNAKTIVAPSYIQYDYALPGVTTGVSNTNDIPIAQSLKFIVSATGEDATTLNTNTDPTNTAFYASVAAGEYFVAEPSILRRYRGNIWERATRMVKFS